jgi:ribonuclease VapC
MIVDTSALLAILLREQEAELFARAIEASEETVRMSVASYLEAALYVDRRGDDVRRSLLDTFIEEFDIHLEPVSIEQIHFARHAFRSYGKGLHPAGLNFGDCFTYALARAKRERVLFKGSDFDQTDLVSALEQ